MGADDRRTGIDDVDALRAENARLSAQLHRIVGALEQRPDIGVHVRLDDVDAVVDVSVARAVPPDGLAEVREVATRLEVIQRDMDRLHQQVEKLLWRLGDRRPADHGR